MTPGESEETVAIARAGSLKVDPATPAPEVSVVVPLFGNAATLPELCQRLVRSLQTAGLSFEVILVDDCSPDGTLQSAERLVGTDNRLGVLALERNVGQHRAVLVGLAHARGARAVVLDGDLQDPPEAIPALLTKADEGFDAVFGGRRGRYQPLPRMLTSVAYKTVQHLLCGVPRDAGMFIALSGGLVGRLLGFRGSGRLTVPAMIGLSGASCTSVPVVRSRRPVGRSSYSGRRRLAIGTGNVAAILRWRCFPASRTVHTLPVVGIARRLGACRRGAGS